MSVNFSNFSQFYCRHLQEHGFCRFRHNCIFSHSPGNSFAIPEHVCFYNLKGNCKNTNENCSFLHISADELIDQLKALKDIRNPVHNSRSNHHDDQPTTSRSSNEKNSAFKKNNYHWKKEQNKPVNVKKEPIICGICLEDVCSTNKKFGLQTNCNHSFCFDCLVEWRKQKNLAEDATKSCPECRLKSEYVIPSKHFAVDEQKRLIIEQYKTNCKKTTCKFEKNGRNYCKYRNCLFKHNLPHNISFTEPSSRPQFSFAGSTRVMFNVNAFFSDSSDEEDFQLSLLAFI